MNENFKKNITKEGTFKQGISFNKVFRLFADDAGHMQVVAPPTYGAAATGRSRGERARLLQVAAPLAKRACLLTPGGQGPVLGLDPP